MGKFRGKSVGVTKMLITAANSNPNINPTNSNLTNSILVDPHSFSPALVSCLLPVAIPASLQVGQQRLSSFMTITSENTVD